MRRKPEGRARAEAVTRASRNLEKAPLELVVAVHGGKAPFDEVTAIEWDCIEVVLAIGHILKRAPKDLRGVELRLLRKGVET